VGNNRTDLDADRRLCDSHSPTSSTSATEQSCPISASEEGMREERRMQQAVHAEHQPSHADKPNANEDADVRQAAHELAIWLRQNPR